MVPQLYGEAACGICNEAITNPICTRCLEKEMVCWMADKNAELNPIVRLATKTFYNTNVSNVRCILCNRKVDICPHCYSKEVAVSLFDRDQVLADTFVEAFDFDLR